MFHRLVSRAVFAIPHGVVSEHENRRQLHQGRESDGGTRVIAEDEECRAKWAKLRERKSIDDRCHGMLADPEMQVFPRQVVTFKVSRAFICECGLVRRSQIGRTSEKPGYV